MKSVVKGFVGIWVLWCLSASVGCRTAGGETVIAERQSPFNTVYVVEDAHGFRRLRFERHGVDQSAVKLGDPDHIEFAYIKQLTNAFALRPGASRVLFIGLGGGTFPAFVRRHLPAAEMDVVELDPVVVDFATEFMGFSPDGDLRIHVGDGRAFVENTLETWDVIVLDAYGIDNIPYALATQQFLAAVRARLAPGGLVVANLWGEAVSPLFPSMLVTYEAVFAETHVIASQGSNSRVVLAFPEVERLASTRLVAAATELRRAWGLRFDLARSVEDGYLPRSAWPRGGHVLVDE